MMLLTGCSRLVSKRVSRPVTIPTTLPFLTTGTPLILLAWVSAINSRTVVSGVTVIGSFTIPASNFFTRRTSAACATMSMFLCKIPIPPFCAIAIAIRDSVTVSIAAETSGIFRSMPRVKRVFKETSFGRTVE